MSFADGLDNEKEKIEVVIEGEEEKAEEVKDAVKDATNDAIESAKKEIEKAEGTDDAETENLKEESKDDAETENLKEESKDDAETDNLKEESKDDAETDNLKEESKDDAETENLKEESKDEETEKSEEESKDSDKEDKESDKKDQDDQKEKDSEEKEEKKEKKVATQKEEPEIMQWLKHGSDHVYPFLIAGGVLLFIAYLIDTINGYGGDISGELLGGITPVAAILKYIAKRVLWFVVPVLAAYVAEAMAGKDGLIVGFVGGILAMQGNAKLTDQFFTNTALPKGEELGVVGRFIAKQAFQQPSGGETASGYLGAICAGLLAGFVVLELKELTDKLPDKLDCIKKIVSSLVAIFLVGAFMCLVFNPLVGTLYSLLFKGIAAMRNAGMITIAALVVGMLINLDTNGLFRQVAYAFGTGMAYISAGYVSSGTDASDPSVVSGYICLAAVMVGGMVAPTGIALSSFIFRKKFTKAERSMAVPNLIMGAGCLTEGAIPAAVNDPVRVIPSTMVGGGIAALIVGLAKVQAEAPIGGILTFNSISSPVIFIAAWLAGSIVTCVMLGLLKKEVVED